MSDNLESLNNDGGHTVKMDLNYSDKKIAEAESLRASGKLQEALDMLLVVENQTRNASDVVSTRRILEAIVKLCIDAKDWALLNEHIFLLATRKSQLRFAFRKMFLLVKNALKLKLIQIKESEGDVTSAENVLHEF
ncbi:hypothetical protein QTP88_011714 [Uroleucon formosanum]